MASPSFFSHDIEEHLQLSAFKVHQQISYQQNRLNRFNRENLTAQILFLQYQRSLSPSPMPTMDVRAKQFWDPLSWSWLLVASLAFDPKPFLQTFEFAVDKLIALRKEIQEKTEQVEKSVRVGEREYSKKMTDLNRSFDVSWSLPRLIVLH